MSNPSAPARFHVSDALRFGWEGFKANYVAVIVIVGVVIAIEVLLGSLASVVAGNAVLSFLMAVVGVTVGFVLALGLIRAALAIADGRKPTTEELLSTDGVWDYAVAALILSLAYAIAIAIGAVSLLLIPVSFLLIIVGSFFVQFFGYAIADERVRSVDGITRSMEVVRANVAPIIVLWLAAVGLAILGVMLCFIGLLVTTPVTAIAYSYAWRTMTGGIVRAPASRA